MLGEAELPSYPWLSAMIGHLGRYVQRRPRIKRIVLKGLRWLPSLEARLRQVYAKTQPVVAHRDFYIEFENQLPEGFRKSSQNSSSQCSVLCADGVRAILISRKNDGINAFQRGPLEKYSHMYLGEGE